MPNFSSNSSLSHHPDTNLIKSVRPSTARYSQVTYIGIADGAASNWQLLQDHTTEKAASNFNNC